MKSKTTYKETLIHLMALAGIPASEYETTTVGQLALRLDLKKAIPTHVKCSACVATYSLAEWLYLKPIGYFMNDGERPQGQKPELEARECRVCGKEIRVKAAPSAPAATPFYQKM